MHLGIYKKTFHYFINEFWDSVTLLGTPVFYIFVIILVAHLSSSLHPVKNLIAFFLLEILCFLLKMLIPKNRPEKSRERKATNVYEERSFPSIHTARVSLLAIFISTTFPHLTLLFVLLVMLVGYSRVSIREHDFIDVLGGIILGLLIGAFWMMF